jgi:predicted outer membrane protein
MSCVTVAFAAFIGSAGCAPTAANETQPQMPASQARVTSADIAPRTEEATSLGMPNEPLSVPAGVETAPNGAAGTPTAVPNPTGAATPARTMTDAQIAAVLEAAIDDELTAARMAEKRTRNALVRALADRIAADEGGAGADLTAFEARHPMAPEHTRTSDDLKAESASAMATLRAVRAVQFDDAYVARQVTRTAQLLELLDATLIPSADAPDLRSELASLRATIAAHAKLARDTQTAYRGHLEATSVNGGGSSR